MLGGLRGCRFKAEWIMDKRDSKEAERCEKTCRSLLEDSQAAEEEDAYRPKMDEMRCLLWAHGGQEDPVVFECLGVWC